MKIVFFSSEAVPFAKTGGMADVCGALPLALEKFGIKVTLIMPAYKTVRLKDKPFERFTEGVLTAGVGQGIRVYFIEHPLFERDGLYGDPKGDYPDNLERFEFYCRRALALLKELNSPVDIAHCHDWQASLIAPYLKFLSAEDPFFKDAKTIMTIHNLAYQGIFPKEKFLKLRLDASLFDLQGFEFYGQVNLLKGGIIFSDVVTTVSPTYAQEIKTRELGCGLEGILSQKKNRVWGILNGLDQNFWDPQHDPFLVAPYSGKSFQDKSINKKHLQKEFGLPQGDQPLLGFVARLSHQKGLDLIFKVIDQIVKMDIQMVFLGVGEQRYHQALEEIARLFPQKIAIRLNFDEPLAHRIYAGADIFLMPSRYEPCGLSQMISLRYGTIPLAYKTGGLADTVFPFDSPDGRGNGFVFEEYTSQAFMTALQRAVGVFHNQEVFDRLVQKAFTHDFSWEKSAREYQKVYESLLVN